MTAALTYSSITLRKYKEEFGDLNIGGKVKSQNDDGSIYNLGKLVDCRRQTKYRLDEEQVAMLDDLGFIWNTEEKTWEDNQRRLLEFKEEFKSLIVEKDYRSPDGHALGHTVQHIRATYTPESQPIRVAWLKEIGFVFDVHALAFDNFYADLVQFKKEHGDLKLIRSKTKIKRADGSTYGLGQAVGRYRSKRLTNDQIQRLNMLGFIW